MSIDIMFYPKKATKTQLINFLKGNSFYKCEHFFESQNNDSQLHFMFFDYENYNSYQGVEATISKVSIEKQAQMKCPEWILSTRTRTLASRKDIEKHNETIKKARKEFGGTFYNDRNGTNKYIDESIYADLCFEERGLFLLYKNTKHKLNKIETAVKDYEHPITKNLGEIPESNMRDILSYHDPSITLFNSLQPFTVALIEHLFNNMFEILLKYDKKASKIIEGENIKLPLKDVLQINKGNLSVESILSREYSFQNIEHINKAYLKYLNIDMLKILSVKKKIDSKIYRISDELRRIIKQRHQMIHNFYFDNSYKKNEFLFDLKVVDKVVELVIEQLDKQNNWKIMKQIIIL